MAILLLTAPDDTAADRVEAELLRRGARVVRFDDKPFPARERLTLRCGPRAGMHHRVGGIALDAIRVAWDRRPRTATVPPHITDPLLRDHIEREATWFMDDVWETLDCTWFPARRLAIRRAEHKASQLQVASSLGFEIPATLITNDPQELLDFWREHDGQVVSKSFMYPAVAMEPGETTHYRVARTEPVTRRDITNFQSVRDCPVVFQAYVPKRVELRVTVVGQDLFAAEIHSQDTNRTRYDWRRYDLAHTVHRRHELPAEVSKRLLAFMAHFGLAYGAADLIVTPDGRYVFLEVNPNGQYGWVERMTGMPIGEAIADWLVARELGAPAGTAEDPPARRIAELPPVAPEGSPASLMAKLPTAAGQICHEPHQGALANT